MEEKNTQYDAHKHEEGVGCVFQFKRQIPVGTHLVSPPYPVYTVHVFFDIINIA